MFKQLGGRLVSTSGAVMPLSPAVEVNGVVYLSGALPLKDGKVAGDDIETQVSIMFDNVETLLRGAGLGMSDVFKVTGWLTRREDFAGYNRIFSQRFADPFPARTTVIGELALPGALVEVEITACRPEA